MVRLNLPWIHAHSYTGTIRGSDARKVRDGGAWGAGLTEQKGTDLFWAAEPTP